MNKEQLSARLGQVVPKYINWTQDVKFNFFGWLSLDHPNDIVDVAKVLVECKARLCTITAYAEKRVDHKKRLAVSYHFIISGLLLTVSVPLYHPETFEQLPVTSITPYFRNADWNEREFAEMYNIAVIGHPNPKRLFLDERIDAGVMGELVPFSALANSANTQKLWENLMDSKGAKKATAEQESFVAMYAAIEEPKFTPVKQKAVKAATENKTTEAKVAPKPVSAPKVEAEAKTEPATTQESVPE